MIGRHLYNHLKKIGRQVLYTTRRKKMPNGDSLYLDLEGNVEHWKVPEGTRTVYFCAAMTSILFCEKHANLSRKVNVTNTTKMIEKFSQRKIPVLFLSSNLVFDGESLYPGETDDANPITEYGKQKLRVEKNIKNLSPKHSIIRATKIIYPGFPIFREWISSLSGKDSIYPFEDYFFSPISIEYFVRILIKISDINEGGVWHVSGDRDISYYDAALLIARLIGVEEIFVKPDRAKNKLKGIQNERSAVMRCNRIESIFGIKAPDVGDTIKKNILTSREAQRIG